MTITNLKNYYAIESIMFKIEEELLIQQIDLEISELDEIRSLLEYILQQHN